MGIPIQDVRPARVQGRRERERRQLQDRLAHRDDDDAALLSRGRARRLRELRAGIKFSRYFLDFVTF